MNTDNTNLETNLPTDSLGVEQAPVSNEPVNTAVEETFSPFQDLNNAPLNVPTENVNVAPVQDFQTEPDFYNPGAQPVANENVDSNVNVTPEPVLEQAPIAPAPVVEPTPVEQTANVDALNSALNPEPVENVTPTFDTMQSTPTIDTFEPVQTAPVVDEIPAQPAATSMPEEPSFAPNVGINDVVMQNTTQVPVVEENNNINPTMPIPDQMPTTDYQAGVSTPVDYATPMSDFDQIGTTPELDPNAKGKKKSNKFLLALLLLIIVGGLGYAAYYFINVKGILNSSSVVVKEVSSEKDETLSSNIDDYATFKNTSSSNCVLNTEKVNIHTIGSYNFTVTCGKKSYTGKVTIKDTKAPEIEAKTNIIVAGTNLQPEMLIDKASEEAKYAYQSDAETANYQTAGLKNIKVNVSDNYSNTKTYIIPVIVTSSEYSMGIVSKRDVTADNTDAKITEKNVILYNNSGGNVNDTSYTAYIIKFNNSTLYKTATKGYDDSGVFKYNNYSGVPLFYSSINTLVLVKDINSDLIKNGFNETFTNVNGVDGYQATLVNQIGNYQDLLDFKGV